MPRTDDLYIEKDSQINEQIDRMRHAATQSLLERNDVIIVASVSCIYGIGSVETYSRMVVKLEVGGQHRSRYAGARHSSRLQYRRNDVAFTRGSFRLRGENVDVFTLRSSRTAPGAMVLFGEEIESLEEFDPLTGERTGTHRSEIHIYANSHYVTPRPTLNQAIVGIKEELQGTASTSWSPTAGCWRPSGLQQRCTFDLEMMETTGSCKSIENYSRYLSGRKKGEQRHRLYSNTCRKTRLLIIDESHVTVPQIGGMERGDLRAQIHSRRIRLPPAVLHR